MGLAPAESQLAYPLRLGLRLGLRLWLRLRLGLRLKLRLRLRLRFWLRLQVDVARRAQKTSVTRISLVGDLAGCLTRAPLGAAAPGWTHPNRQKQSPD